jgi:molybdate transport system regulatory protein
MANFSSAMGSARGHRDSIYPMATRIRFRVDFADHCSLGPGKIALLEAIAQTGSLSKAARDLNMSYRRAWLLIESLNSIFRKPVTAAQVGGKHGGGMVLTPFGKTVIRAYRGLEKDIIDRAAVRLRALARVVDAPKAPSTSLPRRTVSSGRPKNPTP